MGIQTGEARKNHPLIIANSVGLVVMAIWAWLAYRAVKHEDTKLAWGLTVLLPIMYILPVVDITLGESADNCSHGVCLLLVGFVAVAQRSITTVITIYYCTHSCKQLCVDEALHFSCL